MLASKIFHNYNKGLFFERCKTINLTCRDEICSSVLMFESHCAFVFDKLGLTETKVVGGMGMTLWWKNAVHISVTVFHQTKQ